MKHLTGAASQSQGARPQQVQLVALAVAARLRQSNNVATENINTFFHDDGSMLALSRCRRCTCLSWSAQSRSCGFETGEGAVVSHEPTNISLRAHL